MKLDIDQIRERQKRIADEIIKLQKEADDLAVAVRVLERYAEKPTDHEVEGEELPPRPPNIPTTFEMVETILGEAEKAGKKEGLTSRELLDEIRARYWPGVKNKQILPSIFGFSSKGRILRKGDKWRRKPEATQ